VLAGPGTGKTEVLTHRIGYLISKFSASPSEILAVTFSRKAANEMKERLSTLLNSDASNFHISTLHAESLRMLQSLGRSHQFIVSDYETRLLIRDALFETGLAGRLKERECENWIRLAKADNIFPCEMICFDTRAIDLRRIYSRYEELLSYHRATDLAALVMNLVRSLASDYKSAPTIKYLLVDEYQDINKAEHSLILLLSRNTSKLFVVGDDDQSIYGWRGANPSIIRTFQSDFSEGKVLILEESNRCTEHILKGAVNIVSKGAGYIAKSLGSAQGEGERIRILNSSSETREAYWISHKIAENLAKGTWLAERTAVICKRLDLAQTLVDRFGHDHVTSAFWRSTGPLADIEIQQVLACLRLIANRSDDLAVRTCLETRIALGIGSVGIRKLRMEAERANTSLWEIVTKSDNYNLSKWTPAFEAFAKKIEQLAARSHGRKLSTIIDAVAVSLGHMGLRGVQVLKVMTDKLDSTASVSDLLEEIENNRDLDVGVERPDNAGKDAIPIMSMHSAKGLTYDVVFILGLEEGLMPDPNQDISEQRRLLYVAMTRAKRELFMCSSKRRTGPAAGGFSFYESSSFLREIDGEHTLVIDNL
jgi:DNA helicase-2/ATP-dependent DNA helicase PcrA